MTEEQPQPGPRPEAGPARYQRSIAGGVGSLIVLVLVVLAFVAFRAVFRDNGEVEAQPVDYLAVVGPAQQAGAHLVYPPSLPKGWIATSVDFLPGERPGWRVGMLTDDGKFVGVTQQDTDRSELVRASFDGDPVQGDTVTVEGAITPEWEQWSDSGGDHAYAAKVGDTEVLVYGSAPNDDLLTIVRSLTDAPLGESP